MKDTDKSIPELRFPEFEGKWKNKRLEDIGEFLGGGTPATKIDEYWHGDIPWVSSSDLSNESIFYINKYRFINQESIESSATKLIPKNSILIVSRVGVGKVATNDIELCTSQDFINLIPKKDNNVFLAYLIKLKTNKLLEFNQGTSIKGFIKSDLKTLNIIIPTVFEQQKIAAFLITIDKKLTQLEKKKTLLEDYKKGIMQQLFAQTLRFKDENGKPYLDWEEKKLGRVFYSEKGKGLSKGKIIDKGKNDCILYGELYTTYNEVIYEVISSTDADDGLKSELGDLLIPSSTTTTGIDLANVTALNKKNVLLGGDITILRPLIKVNNIFYAYYLSNHKKKEIANYAQGITIVHLYYNHIKEMIIDIPSYDEQTKIANFLSAINKKIASVNSQLENTRQFKKGLLQQMFV